MNNLLENITFEELQNPDNKITPAMLFPDKAGEDEAVHVSDSDKGCLKESHADVLMEKVNDDTQKELFALLEPNTPSVIDLKSLLDKSPMDLFIAEHTVGKPFSAEMFEAGQKYISENLSIIPVGRDKKPLIPWKIYQEKRATLEELLGWFQKFPDMQLAVVTGKISGIICVDVDDPKIDISWLPATALVRTGSGGWHYWYSYVEGFGNRIRIKESIDLKSDAGYVIVPPSSNLKGKYEWIKKIPFAKFPNNLFFKEEIIICEPVKTEYVGFGEGQRNQEMTKYIGHICAKIHPSEWDSIAFPVIQEANKANRPPLNDWELRTIFESICSREKRNNVSRWYNQIVTPIKQLTEVDNLIIKKDFRSRYTWGTRELDTSFSIIKRGNFIVLGAKSSSGKTTYAFDMAQKNALLGHKTLFISLEMDEKEVKDAVARKKACITVEEELDYKIPDNKQSIFESKITEIDAIKNLFFKGVRRGGGLRWEEILNIIYEYKELDLIFIDNLDLIEGESGENDLERQKRIVKKIMGFTSEKQVPIILIHHYRKIMGREAKVANIDDLSGSKKICDGADRVLNISRNKDTQAEYPEKYKSTIYLQKGREYDDALRSVYFMKGTFMDEPLSFEEYYGVENLSDSKTEIKRKIFGVDD